MQGICGIIIIVGALRMMNKRLAQIPPQIPHLLGILLIRRDIATGGTAVVGGVGVSRSHTAHAALLGQQRLRGLSTAKTTQIGGIGGVAGTQSGLVDVVGGGGSGDGDGQVGGVWWVRMRKVHRRLRHARLACDCVCVWPVCWRSMDDFPTVPMTELGVD